MRLSVIKKRLRGFTLIELSVVLVIIGLIIGGVLVGQTLVGASAVRAQITQIEKFNSAANTFYGKYGGLPGDLYYTKALQFGFAVGVGCNGSVLGARNGDDLIQGWVNASAQIYSQTVGETALFWEDLSDSGLIEGKFPSGATTAQNPGIFNCATAPIVPASQIAQDFPTAKIGYTNYVYVYDDFTNNWFGIADITYVGHYGGTPEVTPNIPVKLAYAIDAKIDDGSPITGHVLANYVGITTAPATAIIPAPYTSTSGGTSSSCFDTTTYTYSITQNGGNNGNCAISIMMQSVN